MGSLRTKSSRSLTMRYTCPSTIGEIIRYGRSLEAAMDEMSRAIGCEAGGGHC
jgi:hypothetical protein